MGSAQSGSRFNSAAGGPATGSGTTFGIQEPLIRYDLHSTAEYLIIRKLAATPVDVLLIASLCKNGQRNEPRRLIRSLEPTVGKDNLRVLPSSIGLQFVRKL